MLNTRTIGELASDLRQRREVGDPPPVVMLGAGASIDAGIGAMSELFDFVQCSSFEDFSRYIETRTASERYRLLSRFLQTRQPAAVTAGYQSLAALCADAYFDLMLTTNLDPLLDDALANARLWRKDYLLLVNGVVRDDWLQLLLDAPSPRVKIVKLHGDLFHRCMAWTTGEMDTFVDQIAGRLRSVMVSRDVLVVGHSLRDGRVRQLVFDAGGSIWYVTPEKMLPDFLANDNRVRVVVGPECRFESIFPSLAATLQVKSATAPVSISGGGAEHMPAAQEAQTFDDLMASVLAVSNTKGNAGGTAFMLSHPRVIIADAYAATMEDGHLTLIAGDRRFRARVIARGNAHPFGPLVLEVPPNLDIPGLRLDASPLVKDLQVHVGVAAGSRIGVSSGIVLDPQEYQISIAPVGKVNKCVTIDATVLPGSSGAPVVDAHMSVRGFVIGGGGGSQAIIYPCQHWKSLLASLAADKRLDPPTVGPRRPDSHGVGPFQSA